MSDPDKKSGRFLARFKGAASSRSSGSDSAEGNAEPVSERRREQIRRAQRLHRQRKAEHSQRLASEIADLREKDVAKTARIEHLELTVASLSNLLAQHGIVHELPQAPVDLRARVTVLDNLNVTPSAQGQVVKQRLRITMPSNSSTHKHNNTPTTTTTTFVDLTNTQLGIDFILALEQPCFYHHHLPISSEDEDGDASAMGHSFMLQAPIMARAPALIPAPANNNNHNTTLEPQVRLPPHVSWDVPSEQLETLLRFSDQIRLPDEITPVQAWSRITERGSSMTRPVGKAVLDGLQQALSVLVTCYGFGAVLEKAAFERLLDQYFSSSSSVK